MILPDDTVTLQVAGQAFSGWTDIRIIRGIEVFPSHFVLRVTERLPENSKLFAIDPGATCKLLIGSEVVITGYVDSYGARVNAKDHSVTITGRSTTEDLVDCAAGFTSGHEADAILTFSSPTLLQLAQDLCKPFGITVTEPDGEGTPIVSISGDSIPRFTVPLGTSVYDVLEPVARWKQMLILDGTDGNLVLAKVGKHKAASGFTLPGSVIDAAVNFSKQDRFSIYLPVQYAFDLSRDTAAAAHTTSSNFHTPVRDDSAFKDQPRFDRQPRYRPHVVISEQAIYNTFLCENRAKWELARRYGRSQVAQVTVSFWRDSVGTLWTPNTLAQVDMPGLKILKRDGLITQVMFIKGFGTGTRTQVTLMPKEAFEPEPSFFTPFDPQVAQADRQSLQRSRPAVTTNPRPISVTQGAGV